MASSFNTKVNELGYKIVKKKDENILITKEGDLATIVILFENDKKYISGCIKINRFIYTVAEQAEQYAIFNEMLEDLKTFKELSGYDILN